MVSTPVFAQSAATTITNTARVTYTHGGDTSELFSNTVSTSLLPLIDVSNQAVDVTQGAIDGGMDGFLYGFDVTNPGNTRDSYDLIADFINILAPVAGLWRDTDNDGQLSAGDIRISSSVVTLDPGQTVRILVTAAVAGDMALTATSLSRDPTAIVRNRSATAHIAPSRVVSRTIPSLEKTQAVDMRGASRPGPGTLITYSLTARLPAALEASDIRVTDTIPSGTSYVPGSLRLNGLVLSDTAYFDPSTGLIAVALPGGDADADSLHTVRFQVRIN